MPHKARGDIGSIRRAHARLGGCDRYACSRTTSGGSGPRSAQRSPRRAARSADFRGLPNPALALLTLVFLPRLRPYGPGTAIPGRSARCRR